MAPEASTMKLHTHVFDRTPPTDMIEPGLAVDPHPAAVALATSPRPVRALPPSHRLTPCFPAAESRTRAHAEAKLRWS
jgi:hypothetical protein